MRIVTFASGSTGNCSLISDGGANILIDAGISMRRTVAALNELGLSPQDLCGVLITHEHSDHISGLSMLAKHHNISIFAPSALCEVLCTVKPELKSRLYRVPVNDTFVVGDIEVRAFRTPHDSKYSVGYRFEDSSSIAFATDTGSLTDELVLGLEGAELALIEANHDIEMLKNGPYPYFLKRRILSDRGHLSNDDCAKLALYLAKSGTKDIILGHLSRENNTAQTAFDAVNAAICGESVALHVAPMDKKLAISVEDSVECLI